MHSKHINGLTSEYLAAAWFTSKGFTVSLPLNPFAEYDLIVDKNDDLLRVQVKTIFFDNNKHRYICNFALSHINSDGSTRIKKYDKNSFDYCAAVCREQNAIYILPIKHILGRRSITFYPDREGVKNSKRYRHYEEYKDKLFNYE